MPAHASSERIRQEIQRLQNLSIDIPTAAAKIQQGTPLKLGMHGERVVQLLERLRQLGWPLSEHHNDIFDEAIDHAVRIPTTTRHWGGWFGGSTNDFQLKLIASRPLGYFCVANSVKWKTSSVKSVDVTLW